MKIIVSTQIDDPEASDEDREVAAANVRTILSLSLMHVAHHDFAAFQQRNILEAAETGQFELISWFARLNPRHLMHLAASVLGEDYDELEAEVLADEGKSPGEQVAGQFLGDIVRHLMTGEPPGLGQGVVLLIGRHHGKAGKAGDGDDRGRDGAAPARDSHHADQKREADSERGPDDTGDVPAGRVVESRDGERAKDG